MYFTFLIFDHVKQMGNDPNDYPGVKNVLSVTVRRLHIITLDWVLNTGSITFKHFSHEIQNHFQVHF